MKQFDVLVIGAGVVGGMIAREMTRYALNVGIVEKEADVAMGASSANSAIVHAGFDAEEGSLKAQLNVKGSQIMEKVAEELGVKYRRCTSLVVAFSQDGMPELEKLLERGKNNGVEGLKILSREEVLEKEPRLTPTLAGALYAPTGAIICPYELTVASVGNAMDNGAQLFLNNKVERIEKESDLWIVSTDKERFSAKVVINCAGLYSDEIANMAGKGDFTVTPRRGEYMLFDKTVGDTVSSTVFTLPTKLGKGILISPTVDGNLILGPTAENIDDKEDKKTTAEGLEKVKNLASEELVKVPREVITSFTGLRAVGSTGDFIINENDAFINVAGIESPGLSASPAIAEYVSQLVGKCIKLNLQDDFNPRRESTHIMSKMTDGEKADFIKQNPSWGRIICRCEEISEGEIVAALHTNPPAMTVDAIKRRTRATMGRCQGGFCVPHIAEIMARELNIDVTEITKNGKGSEYVLYERG